MSKQKNLNLCPNNSVSITELGNVLLHSYYFKLSVLEFAIAS